MGDEVQAFNILCSTEGLTKGKQGGWGAQEQPLGQHKRWKENIMVLLEYSVLQVLHKCILNQ